MNCRFKISVLAGVFLLSLPGFTYPQISGQKIHNFISLRGLPSKIVTAVFKDSRGFMWFGTENGLYRYDGYEFRGFHHDPADTNSLSGNMIWEILLEDTDGNLWISTLSNGLNIFNPNTGVFKHYREKTADSSGLNFNRIKNAVQDKKGEIWLAAYNGQGLINFDESTGNFKIYYPVGPDPQNISNKITALYLDRKGGIWVGTFRGLFYFDLVSRTFVKLQSLVTVPEEMNEYPVTGILEDKNDIFWISTNAGIFKYSAEKKNITQFKHKDTDPQSLCSNFILESFENPMDEGNSLWVVTRMGINKLEKATGKVTRFNHDPDDPLSKSFDAIFDMYLDDNGMLWAATGFAGAIIFNLNVNPFTGFKIGPFGKDPYLYEATSFLEDRSANIWVGTGFGGLLKYNHRMNLIARYYPDPGMPFSISSYYIYSLFEDTNNVLWVGTSENLDVFDMKTNRFLHCSLPAGKDIPFIRINDIYRDSFGYLWIGTSRGLFYQHKQSKLDISFQQVPGFFGNAIEIRKIAEDHSGIIWFGSTGKGLFQLIPDNRNSMSLKNYMHDPKDKSCLSDDVVWSVYIDQAGILWCGTSAGLNRFDRGTGKFTCFNTKNGLNANFIFYIEGDNCDNLWLSTEKGIIRFRQTTDSTAHSKLYERADGIPYDDNYQYKIFKDKHGKIYVGGRRASGNGFYCFYPDSLKDNQHIPPIVLTELLVNNKPVKSDSAVTAMKQIRLRYNQNFFSISFSALDFVNPSGNAYAYKLEGFDKDWIYCKNQRMANYTNVPAGDYIFRVKGANNDGLWNEEGTSLAISISAPPWKTWWAYLVYVIVFFGLLFGWQRYDLKRRRLKQQLQIEHVESEKMKELDSMKTRFFANISHEFRTPLTLILGPVENILKKSTDSETNQELNMVQRNARRLLKMVNQLLSLSRLEAGQMKLHARKENIVNLIKGYVQSFESLARQKKLSLDIHIKEPEIHLYIDRDKFEQVINNLLSNAIKFTPEGGRIVVEVRSPQSAVSSQQFAVRSSFVTTSEVKQHHASHVTITITDTGIGIPPGKLPYIFDRFYQVNDTDSRAQEGTGIGLALVKQLVELHYGSISVESEEGKGTTFIVNLPLGKEHLKEDEIGCDDLISNIEYPASSIQHPASSIQHPASSIQHQEAKPLILIVEDNADMRSYMKSCLDPAYDIIEATDGKDGLDKTILQIPDLVISDVMMPVMDGNEMCRKLKTDERTNHIPVILLTAKASKESRIEGLETGADDFITKPFDVVELQVRVKNLIEQRRKLKEQFINNLKSPGFYKVLQQTGSRITSRDQQFLKKAIAVVNAHLPDPDFSIKEFSLEMAMSHSQLFRKLKALVDLSPNEFIRTARLQQAAELIMHHSANIGEIAYSVGFNNPSYFSECFKKQFGKLPSEFSQSLGI